MDSQRRRTKCPTPLGGTDDASSFDIEIDTSGGQVNLKATGQLDLEGKASYSVTVTATDSDSNSATLSVTIKVTNVDEKPEISGGTDCEENTAGTGYECEYAENGTGSVETFTAEDPEGATITWDLTGTDSANFRIVGGVLRFAVTPDYEAPADDNTDNTYEVTVTAADAAADVNTAEKTVTVEVTNVEEPGKVMITVAGTGVTIAPLPVLLPQVDVELTATLSDEDLRAADGSPVTLSPTWQVVQGQRQRQQQDQWCYGRCVHSHCGGRWQPADRKGDLQGC